MKNNLYCFAFGFAGALSMGLFAIALLGMTL